jgi:hypothetical protein
MRRDIPGRGLAARIRRYRHAEKGMGGSGVDRNGGARPRSEDYGALALQHLLATIICSGLKNSLARGRCYCILGTRSRVFFWVGGRAVKAAPPDGGRETATVNKLSRRQEWG